MSCFLMEVKFYSSMRHHFVCYKIIFLFSNPSLFSIDLNSDISYSWSNKLQSCLLLYCFIDIMMFVFCLYGVLLVLAMTSVPLTWIYMKLNNSMLLLQYRTSSCLLIRTRHEIGCTLNIFLFIKINVKTYIYIIYMLLKNEFCFSFQ